MKLCQNIIFYSLYVVVSCHKLKIWFWHSERISQGPTHRFIFTKFFKKKSITQNIWNITQKIFFSKSSADIFVYKMLRFSWTLCLLWLHNNLLNKKIFNGLGNQMWMSNGIFTGRIWIFSIPITKYNKLTQSYKRILEISPKSLQKSNK